MLGKATVPLTRLVEIPGRGTTRVWECPGPPGAETVMLIHGVACTAELNWGKVFAPLAHDFRVVAADLRGHGDGIPLRSTFRLEDCADDIAALAGVLGIGRFTAVGYSMGGMVAQLLYRRHPELVSALVLCSTARNVRGSRAEDLAALAMPAVAAALRWNPMLYLMGSELLGTALLGPVDDPATAQWARAQLHRTTMATAISASQAVSEFSSNGWIGQVDVPPRWSSRTETTLCRPAASWSWPRRSRARRSTMWTPITEHASARRTCSPARCWRPAGRQHLAAQQHPAHAGLTRPAALRPVPGPPGSQPDGTRFPARTGPRRRVAGHDVAAAERQLANLDVLDQPLQVAPWPVESLEAAHVGECIAVTMRVDAHHDGRGPLAAARGHPGVRPQAVQDVPQCVRGLQDVVHGAEQRRVGADPDLARPRPAPAPRSRCPSPGWRCAPGPPPPSAATPRCRSRPRRAHLVPQQAAAQPRAAAHVQDHLPRLNRKRIHDGPAVGLECAGPRS